MSSVPVKKYEPGGAEVAQGDMICLSQQYFITQEQFSRNNENRI